MLTLAFVWFQEDEKFLQTLFAQLVDEDTDDSKRRDLTLFLKEFCTFSQTLQAQSRDYSFFKVFVGNVWIRLYSTCETNNWKNLIL